MKIQKQPKPRKTQQVSNGSPVITARGLPFWYQIPANFRVFLMGRFRDDLPTNGFGSLPSPPGSQNGSQNLIITARGLPFWYQIPADFSIFGIDRFRTPLFSSFSKMMFQKNGVLGPFPSQPAGLPRGLSLMLA